MPIRRCAAILLLGPACFCCGSNSSGARSATSPTASPARPGEAIAVENACRELPAARGTWPLQLRALAKACEIGEAGSCHALGISLSEGRDGVEDFEAARSLLECACAKHHPDGCNGLGTLFQHGRGV